MRHIRMTPKRERQIEDRFRNDHEAHALLDIINAEFQSDPTSTQCFDKSIVERVAYCVALRKHHKKTGVILF